VHFASTPSGMGYMSWVRKGPMRYIYNGSYGEARLRQPRCIRHAHFRGEPMKAAGSFSTICRISGLLPVNHRS